MTEDLGLIRVKLVKNLYSSGKEVRFPLGTVLNTRIGLSGYLEAEAAPSRYVSLRPDQWELVVTDEDLQRLLDDS